MTFKLHETLERDSHYVTNFNLCQVRLIDNANYPWFILIPMKNGLVEITDLNEDDFGLFNSEIRKIAIFLQKELNPDKLNIAAIGNIVPQLHMHVIARFKNDKLFPKTVWGDASVNYGDKLNFTIDMFRKKLEYTV